MADKKYFYFTGMNGQVDEIDDYDKMIEVVRQHQLNYDRLPKVIYGERLDFEPAEIVKSWKIK
jgi:hypothetical protein